MIIQARAPLRLGMAGGGTDVSPYCDKYGGYVLNASIDRYAYTVIKTLEQPIVKFAATDLNIEVHNELLPYFELDGILDLHKAVYNHIIKNYNNGVPISMEVSTFCDAPIGSGLGASSTLVVSMIRAFIEFLNLSLDDYSIAHLAYQIERVDCKFSGGRQDQYSAVFGGFNFMEFYDDNRAIITPLRVKNWILNELEASLVIFYVGVSRESSKIITDQSNNVKKGSIKAINAMHGIKNEAFSMKECLLRGDFPGMVESMKLGWENKKKSAETVSNSHIDEIFNKAIKAGALAGKISGAGGGGFILFFVKIECRMNVISALSQYEGQVSNCHFTKNGAQAWRIA
jgi:D-glycero-alpha-D-manno-heptose-7-phosphate kinase